MPGKTLYDKIWDAHVAHEAEDGTCFDATIPAFTLAPPLALH